MNKTNKILLALAIVVILGFAIYHYSSKQIQAPESALNSTTTPATNGQTTTTSGTTGSTNTKPGTAGSGITATVSGYKTYSDPQLNFTFKYPASWETPLKTNFGSRVRLDFKNGFTVESGQYINASTGQPMIIDGILSNIAARENGILINYKLTSTTISAAGTIATKITYEVVSSHVAHTQVYIPTNTAGTSFIMLDNTNSRISSETYNTMVQSVKLK